MLVCNSKKHTTLTHIQTIITIILGAGILGGLTNFFLGYDNSWDSKNCWIFFFKTILLSTCASITVPLFLQVISNNLLDNSPTSTPAYPTKNYFILAGFCILAAFYSKRFLEDLYDRVNKVEKQADNAERKVEQLENNSQEIDANEKANEIQQTTSTTNSTYTKEQITSVLKSMLNSKYTYRTISGIVADTSPKLDEDIVLGILTTLKSYGYAAKKTNGQGVELWRFVNRGV